jgi:uncharacterized membrane protein (UPF0127 family)
MTGRSRQKKIDLMNTRILNCIYICLAIGALFGALFWRPELSSYDYGSVVHAGDLIIPVNIADTVELREQGLSGTTSLPKGTGKLFIFDTPGVYGFWMKGMHYPIDIVWIDESWRVVGLTTNATPESYPTIFYPPASVRYVLELNSGETQGDIFATGATVHFEK